MKRARQTLRLHRVTVRALSHVIGGAPALGNNGKMTKVDETDKCHIGGGKDQ